MVRGIDHTEAVAILARDPTVGAVYAFGSRARDEARPGSDVDIAVLLDGTLTLEEELRLRAGIAAALGREDVDLVFLREAPPLLKYEVISARTRLYARDAAAADEFEARAMMEYFDTAHLRAVQRKLAREALA